MLIASEGVGAVWVLSHCRLNNYAFAPYLATCYTILNIVVDVIKYIWFIHMHRWTSVSQYHYKYNNVILHFQNVIKFVRRVQQNAILYKIGFVLMAVSNAKGCSAPLVPVTYTYCSLTYDDVIIWTHLSALLALCERNSPVTGGFPSQWASNAEFLCFLWFAPEQTPKQASRRRWFETPSCSLWRHCNERQSM